MYPYSESARNSNRAQFHPELYGKNGNVFWPRVIICYAQWVPFEMAEVPDEAWFDSIRKGCILDSKVEVKPMSALTKQWIFTNIREFEHPYVKSTLLSDSRTLTKDGWAKWCTDRVEAIIKPEADSEFPDDQDVLCHC